MHCLNCGKVTNRKKFCSKECMLIYKRKEVELKKPPLYKECQFCGKPLQHRVNVKENIDGKKTSYFPNKKYCNKQCEASHRKIWMKNKPTNFKSSNKKVTLSVEFPTNVTDPLTFIELEETNV